LLQGISKRGDTYLRTLLILGSRAALRVAEREPGYQASWLARLLERRDSDIASVAWADKIARSVWVLLAHDQDSRTDLPPAMAVT